MTKSDPQLRQDVERELGWDPQINATQIGVRVERGAVSLLGRVDSYAEKVAAQHAARRVSGVRTVNQSLAVALLSAHERSDADLAAAVDRALAWDVFVPDGVTGSVHSGVVELTGAVTWNHQRCAAEQAIANLAGVVDVTNAITLEPRSAPSQVKQNVRAALQRRSTADVGLIHVDELGGKVTLTGYASSWRSVADAANAAWAEPGVTEVVDRVKLTIKH